MKDLIKSLFRDRIIKWTLISIGGLILLLLVFQAGIFVGVHKAGFSRAYSDNYEKNFGGPKMIFQMRVPPGIAPGELMNGHGTAGQVVKIDDDGSIVIKGVGEAEKIINTDDNTFILRGRDNIRLTDINPGDQATVIGAPDDKGNILAKIIRIFYGTN